ncbi:MAG: M1 family metallopeptidase [Corallococcus sp.]|nr:M1 family metallopeptidase [Corallococcus sp.]MCM1359556.1 M1 family metallopeptidase [Corallococcus sp.]MCM1395148.1 M1 family metallopeptidase [Corallococcus sp.]
MKKRILCLTLVAVLIASAVVFAACNGNPLDNASKNADNYTIVCAFDDGAKVLTAVQTVETVNRSENSLNAIKFHLYANAYREDAKISVVPTGYESSAYYHGKNWGDITIDGVKINGEPAAFTIEGEDADILCVPTAKEWFPDDKATVEITYTVKLANLRHRLGWTENSVNLGNFYPVLCKMENGKYCDTPYYNVGDPYVTEIANYDVTVKFAEDYVVASTGNLVEAESAEGFVTYNYVAKAVRDFAIVASQNFKTLSQTVDGVTINYYYYNDADSEASLATAVGAYKFFNQNVGKYPYDQISVCETEFCFGGMEYPQLVMITSGGSAYLEAVAHEIAHQWFYGIVGNDQIQNAWMDEGLAEFLTYLYLDDAGTMPLAQSIKANYKTYTTYVDVLNNYYTDVDISFRSLPEYRNDNEYVVMTYVKGSLLFNTLYETMGKAKFFKALSAYYDDASFTVAPPSQMIQCFAKIGGNEIASIFNNFAEGKEILGKLY